MKVYELFREDYEYPESMSFYSTLGTAMSIPGDMNGNRFNVNWESQDKWPPGYGGMSAYGTMDNQVFYIREREVKE